jgi:peptidoglycan/LPS O-acetylase OafA/YrhL
MNTEIPEVRNENEPKPKVFFPNLDGLRFFSFFLVFLSHSFFVDYDYIARAAWYKNMKFIFFTQGWLGVSFFFVLSGFLISYLLMAEKNHTGRIHVISFYIRRALRIWPLYYFCVFFGFVIFPILKRKFGQVPDETADPILCSLFLNNFNAIKNGPPDASVLSVLWSVAIEEQFYLVWPVLFYFTPRKNFVYLFCAVILTCIAYRILHMSTDVEDFNTLAVISDMAIGGLGAYFSINSKRFMAYLEKSNPFVNLIPYLAIAVYVLTYRYFISVSALFIIFNRVILASFFIWIILEQNYCKRSYFKVSQLKVISTLGKYTYGLYCLHMIAILITLTVVRKFGLNKHSWEIILIQVPFAFGLSIVISYLSYTYYESWFLKFKDKFAFVVRG